jgi:hypothetical protein
MQSGDRRRRAPAELFFVMDFFDPTTRRTISSLRLSRSRMMSEIKNCGSQNA